MAPLQLLLLLLPWAWGLAFTGWCLAPAPDSTGTVCRGLALVSAGAGCYLGYFAVAAFLYGANALGLPPFTGYLAFAVLTGLPLGAAALRRWRPVATAPAPAREPAPARVATALFLALALFAVAFSGLESTLRPAETWDTLQHWSVDSAGFLSHHEGANPGEPFEFTRNTHWPTVKLIAAWSGWAASLTDLQYAVYAPWLLLQFALGLAAAGLALGLTGRASLAALAGYLAVSSPMVTTHVALPGYADFWQAGGVLLFMTLVLVETGMNRTLRHLLACLLLATAVALTKGNGIIYTLILAGSVALALLLAKARPMLTLALLAAAVAAAAIAATIGFDLRFGGYRIAFLPGEDLVALGKRTSGIPESNWAGIAGNLLEAWGRAASYHGAIATLIVLVPLLVILVRPRRAFATCFSLVTPLALAAFFVVAQRYGEYFYRFATPDNDSGLTRFSMIVFLSLLPAPFVILASLRRDKAAAPSAAAGAEGKDPRS